MKKLIASIILAGSLALTGCGSSNDNFVIGNGGGNQNPPVVQGYFVNSATGNDATGAFATGSRFATIQAALLAAPAGSDIIVEPGNYAGTVNLDNGDRLLGSESTLLMGTATTRPILAGNIDMADGNTIDFMALQGSNVDAISGDGHNGGTVTNCQISNTVGVTSAGFEITGASGTWTIRDNTFTDLASAGIILQGTGATTLRAVIENNTMTNCRGAMITGSNGTSQLTIAVRRNAFINSAGVGTALELNCGAASNYCLDLENNTNDDVYRLLHSPTATGTFSVEQRDTLNAPKPGGANNTGTINDSTDVGGMLPSDLADGLCGI